MDDKTKGIDVERTKGRSDEYVSGREALDTDGRIGERGTSRIPTRTPGAGAGGSDTTRNFSTSGSSLDAPTEERTREIRAEIEQTRGEMTETVNAIQDRLRPGNIAANAAESVKSTVKNVAEDKAQVVADYARDMVDSEPVQYVRANPIPTAMIGIGIAGLTWLALGGREGRAQNRYRSGRTSRDWRRLAPYNEGDRYYRGGGMGPAGYTGMSGYTAESGFGDAGFGEAGYPGQGGFETAAAYDPDLSSGARDYSGTADYAGRRDFGGDYRSSTGQAAGELSRTAQEYTRRAQQTTRGAQRKLQRAWQQNPLMMGAASAVLGLIVGMALPQTDIENEYMGEARDNAIEGVQETVREKVNQAKDAATSAVGLITGDQKPSGSQGQQQSGGQGQPATPGTPGAQPGGQAGQAGSAGNRPGSQGPSQGSQGQQTGGTGQPSKKPGIA